MARPAQMPRGALLLCSVFLLTILPLIGTSLRAQETEAPSMQRTQLSDRVWMLTGRGGNVGVVVTDEGVIVIDDQFENMAPLIVEQVRAVTDQPIRYVINTHVHGDHVGGNGVLQEYADVIAHHNTYGRMLRGWEGEGQPRKGDGLPEITFDSEMNFHLGGVEIELFHIDRGHTDTDVAVWIASENVVHMGDLFFNGMAPYVDKANGAYLPGWSAFIGTVLQRIGPNTRVIPGHGELSDVAGLRNMGRYVRGVRQVVAQALEEGKSKDEILALPISSLGEDFAVWDDRRFPMSLEAAYSELVGLGPTLLVVNKSDDTLAFIDVETNGFRGLVPTGPGPHEVAATPNGKLGYVTNYMSGRPAGTRSWLTVVDLEAMRPVRDIELKNPANDEYLSAPHGIMITPDGSDLWVTVEGSGAVARISLPDEKVAAVYETGQRVSHQVVPLPDGSKAYVANIGSGSVSVVDVATGSVKTIECQPGTEGIDVSTDGSEVWATNREAGTISIIDTGSDEVIDTVTSGDFPIRVKFTPDGRHALVSNARDGEVAVFDAATREIVRTIPTGAMPIGLLILPDGSKAYAANTASDRVSVIDLSEWSVSGTISTGREPDGLSLVVRQ